MYYMNTDRDNFQEWARDKPDTSFAALHRADGIDAQKAPVVKWGRLAIFAVLGVALVLAFKLLAGL
ncbi:hypothetical protein E5CHR_01601 [Variovorax sp. PBL-E5]|nr:hypothetical protein E5CHR_01601 [Variovorax sp. PBL-E5]